MTPTQRSLPAARATDPETSKSAAASLGRGVEREVMRVHRLHSVVFWGEGGLTDDELVYFLPDLYAPTVKSARSRLSKAGLLCDSGARRLSGRKRAQIVWRLA